MKFTREITVTPAYDCVRAKPCVHGVTQCGIDPMANHGVKGSDMRLHLGTDDHEVVLTVNTGWYLPQTPKRGLVDTEFMGSSVGWHSQSDIAMEETRILADPANCPRGWEVCYSSMAYILANEGALLLVTEGTDAVWAWLEELYNDRFGKVGNTEDE